MTLKSRVVALRSLSVGESVGYGCAYTARSRKRIATISIGYADGLPRAASGYPVYIRGIPCPILGNICMDACMVDVTHLVSLEIGEEVTIFGGEASGANVLARQAESIPYEILARIGTRAPIHYC
jgi:alanine racemase